MTGLFGVLLLPGMAESAVGTARAPAATAALSPFPPADSPDDDSPKDQGNHGSDEDCGQIH